MLRIGARDQQRPDRHADEAAGDDEWTFSEDDLMLDEEDDPHLNGIARDPAGKIIVVGERGSAFRTADGGTTWERLQLPYGYMLVLGLLLVLCVMYLPNGLASLWQRKAQGGQA